MLTFLVLNVPDTKQKLGNDVLQAAGVAQKYNCSLVRLDYQQDVYKRQARAASSLSAFASAF